MKSLYYWNVVRGRLGAARVCAGLVGPHGDFWRLVQIGGPDECWPWLGPRSDKGYGLFEFVGLKQRAHCTVWEITRGRSIPKGLCGTHTCDNPPCCNPSHVWVRTVVENNLDRDRKGRAHDQRGGGNSNAKLGSEQVEEIRKARAAGVPGRILSERFSVSVGHVYNLGKGRFWKP